MIPVTFAEAMDFKRGDKFGIGTIDNNPVIHGFFSDILEDLKISDSKENQINSISDISISFDGNEDVLKVLNSIQEKVQLLKLES